jgi:hypothetical protein
VPMRVAAERGHIATVFEQPGKAHWLPERANSRFVSGSGMFLRTLGVTEPPTGEFSPDDANSGHLLPRDFSLTTLPPDRQQQRAIVRCPLGRAHVDGRHPDL